MAGEGKTLTQLENRRETRAESQAAELPVHRRPRGTLYRYVIREALLPSAFALIGLTAVVLTKDLLGFSDLVINRGIDAGSVAWLAFLKAVPVASRIFPFALLVGSMVALGRMGADREILVLEASGVAAPRLLGPIASLAAGMTALALALSLVLSPWASRSQDQTLEEISREKPWAQIRAGAVNEFGGVQLEAREVSAAGDRLKGVLLWMPDVGHTIFAREGRVASDADGTARVILSDGSVVLSPRRAAQQIRFDELSTSLPGSDQPLLRSRRDRVAGLPLRELARRAEANGGVRREGATTDEVFPHAAAELHRRLALPLATLVFGFLAVPLFLSRTHFSRAGGGVLGLLCTVAYYGLVQLGEGLVTGAGLPVAAAVWLPNAALGLLAAGLLLRLRREGSLGHAFDRPQRAPRAPRLRRNPGRLRPRRLALPRYIAGRFVELGFLSFAVLLVAYLLIDVMERLEWFATHGASGIEVLRFYAARLPLLASRAVPMAMLVATALTVSLLAVEGELIGMRACGIPAPRALVPVLVLATLVAPIYFALNNVVVPRTNALADELKRTEIKDQGGAGAEARTERSKAGDWYRSGAQVVEAERFDASRGEAREIAIYELGDDGLPISRTDARFARHIGGGRWRLDDPARIAVSEGTARKVEAESYQQLGEALAAKVDTMHLSVGDLGREIEEVEDAGYDATVFRVDYHVRLAEPLACIVLPAVVLFFAVGGPPFPGPAQTLLVSGILGVSYILLTGVAASLGYGKAIPPAAGGWGPTAAFALLAGFFGLRLWKRL